VKTGEALPCESAVQTRNSGEKANFTYLRSDERIAKCCGVSVTTVSNRRTKNKGESEGCRLSARGKKRTRKSERNIFADEFDLHVVKKKIQTSTS